MRVRYSNVTITNLIFGASSPRGTCNSCTTNTNSPVNHNHKHFKVELPNMLRGNSGDVIVV